MNVCYRNVHTVVACVQGGVGWSLVVIATACRYFPATSACVVSTYSLSPCVRWNLVKYDNGTQFRLKLRIGIISFVEARQLSMPADDADGWWWSTQGFGLEILRPGGQKWSQQRGRSKCVWIAWIVAEGFLWVVKKMDPMRWYESTQRVIGNKTEQWVIDCCRRTMWRFDGALWLWWSVMKFYCVPLGIGMWVLMKILSNFEFQDASYSHPVWYRILSLFHGTFPSRSLLKIAVLFLNQPHRHRGCFRFPV